MLPLLNPRPLAAYEVAASIRAFSSVEDIRRALPKRERKLLWKLIIIEVSVVTSANGSDTSLPNAERLTLPRVKESLREFCVGVVEWKDTCCVIALIQNRG
ncbi:hypothetical protein DPMN_156823 [Dreissena polymorpha]|uniref:Uncharacterized protein n=1 Tax=Dreissena polymorpha TaxID=45954 RepID=A0A9D4J7X1_DREPO|nr:hypothetical protein DPMN_156823 [Dreissena polymorpha]